MSVNIYDLANELERAIRQLPEYREVEAAKAAIDKDNEAKQLWQEFMTFQTKLQGLMQAGQMPSADDQAEMTDLSQRLEKNLQVKTFFDSQQRLSVYVADLEKIIFQPLRDLL